MTETAIRPRQVGGPFAMTPGWVIMKFGPLECKCYSYLALKCDYSTRECRGVSRKVIAEVLGCSVSTVDNVLRRLREGGAIVIERNLRADGSLDFSTYWLMLDDPSEPGPPVADPLPQPVGVPTPADKGTYPSPLGYLPQPVGVQNTIGKTIELLPHGSNNVGRDIFKQVFDNWKRKTGHKQALPTPDRRKLILTRVKEGSTLEELLKVPDGCLASPFHQGDNKYGKVYDGFELLYRNRKQIEMFCDLVDRPLKTPEAREAERDKQFLDNLKAERQKGKK